MEFAFEDSAFGLLVERHFEGEASVGGELRHQQQCGFNELQQDYYNAALQRTLNCPRGTDPTPVPMCQRSHQPTRARGPRQSRVA